MYNQHVAQHSIVAGTVGGINFGIANGLLEDGDLTSLDNALGEVDTRAAVLHVSQRTFAPRVKASLRKAEVYQPGYNAGGDATAIRTIDDVTINGRSLIY